jgi:hypothetical protein
MFYVGVFAHYDGTDKASDARVTKLEKLGHSLGRGERFLNQHPPQEVDGRRYRALIFQMPDRFILRNDVIQKTMRVYQCDWQTAKFHCYRLAATNIFGKQDVWADALAAAEAQTPAQVSEPDAPAVATE